MSFKIAYMRKYFQKEALMLGSTKDLFVSASEIIKALMGQTGGIFFYPKCFYVYETHFMLSGISTKNVFFSESAFF